MKKRGQFTGYWAGGMLLALLLTLLAAVAWADVPIDQAHFPDAAFRAFLKDPSIDQNEDGILSEDEIEACTSIWCGNRGISDLTGIQIFVNLQSLSCASNQLTSLDVRENTQLTYLGCDSNRLTELDLSRNKKLEELFCENNRLTELDLRKNPNLTYVSCYSNRLTALDLSRNTKLEELDCGSNRLTALNLSRNTKLEELYCGSNRLTELDVSRNTALKRFFCYSNRLTSLDVSGNAALIYLACSENRLTELDILNNPALINLYCDGNRLTSLTVGSGSALKFIYCRENGLTALDIRNATKLEGLYCNNNRLTSLNLSRNKLLYSMNCCSNQLSKLNLSKNTRLFSFSCWHNNITVLDVSHCRLDEYVTETVPYVEHDPTDNHEIFVYEYKADTRFGVYTDLKVKLVTSKGTFINGKLKNPVTGITLNPAKATLTRTAAKPRPTLKLAAAVSPKDATDQRLTWSSSNPKVAKVNQKGLVTALKAGKAVITCLAKDGSGVKAVCRITVRDLKVGKIILNRTRASLEKGERLRLKVKKITPADALNPKVKWTSSNTKIATVSSDGTVLARGTGTVIITCTARDGSGKKAVCRITVTGDR